MHFIGCLPSNNELLSKTITFLRLPLIVGVVFIHTCLTNASVGGITLTSGQYPIHDIIRYIISEEFARVAVPLFFFMSGFLFFYSSADFTLATYKNKLSKRIHTLLIPYLVWNVAFLVMFFLTQTFMSSMTSGANKLIADYSIIDWIRAFWNHKDGMPICYQLWFIRDLIVVVLFAPVVYWVVKYLRITGLLLFGFLWCFDIWVPLTGVSSVSFFFFTFGAWFAINNRDFVDDFKFLRPSFTFLYGLIVVANTLIWYNQVEGFSCIHNLGIVVGLIMIVTWVAHGIKSNRLMSNAFWASSSFFVYAYHTMPLTLFVKLYIKVVHPTTEFAMILGYLLIPLIVVLIGVIIYMFIHRFFPKFTRIITGGR